MPKDKHKTKYYFDNQTINEFIESIKGHRYETAYLLMLTTGISARELVALEWNDLCTEQNTDFIIVSKYGTYKQNEFTFYPYNEIDPKYRIVPICLELSRQLTVMYLKSRTRQLHTSSNCNLIFTTEKGRPYHTSDLMRSFNRVFKMWLDTPQMCSLQNTATVFMYERLEEMIADLFLGKCVENWNTLTPISQKGLIAMGRKFVLSWNKVLPQRIPKNDLADVIL